MDRSINQFDYDAVDPNGYDFDNCHTRRHKDAAWLEVDVVAAIKATRGNFTAMAALLGRNRSRTRHYVMSRSDIKEVWDDVRASILDQVEDQLFAAALDGDGSSQRFVLEKLAADRGYGKNQISKTEDEGVLVVEGGVPGRSLNLPQRLH